MRISWLAAVPLAAGILGAAADSLAAQALSHTFAQAAAGVVAKPAYGQSHSRGLGGTIAIGKFLASRLAFRLDAEYHAFGYEYVVTSPCLPPFTACGRVLGNGRIRSTALLANLEFHAQPGGAGFYVVAGLGPDYLGAHPDRPPGWRLTWQAGAGIAAYVGPAALLLEARYQVHAGAGAQPPHSVPLTLGLRLGR